MSAPDCPPSPGTSPLPAPETPPMKLGKEPIPSPTSAHKRISAVSVTERPPISRHPLFLLVAAVPLSIPATLYMFLLPWLSEPHNIVLFGHELFTLPAFARPGTGPNAYWTLSHYISNPHGTGGMAATFAGPCVLLWFCEWLRRDGRFVCDGSLHPQEPRAVMNSTDMVLHRSCLCASGACGVGR